MYLNCRSYYSSHFGMLSPSQLVARAAELGIRELALTDINSTSGIIEFLRACDQVGIHGVVGVEFRHHLDFYYIGLAETQQGFSALTKLLNTYLVEKKPLPRRAPKLKGVVFIYDYKAPWTKKLRSDEWCGVKPNAPWKQLKAIGSHKAVALHPVTLSSARDMTAHKLLRCIDLNILSHALLKSQHCESYEFMKHTAEIQAIYRFQPRLVVDAVRILRRCQYDLRGSAGHNKKIYTRSAAEDISLLRRVSYDGLRSRYGTLTTRHFSQLEKEIKIVSELSLQTYFLIAWDIVRFARSKGYAHVGRGSGANSLLAYCLRISNVDPIDLNLYFERFINRQRPEPPDFDLDFSWDQRDEIVEYLRQRYGAAHLGVLACYHTYKGKSLVRELGKVFGLPPAEINKIIEHPLAREQHHPIADKIFKVGKRLLKFPSHLSIHPGGIVITEIPLDHFCASQMMPKGTPVLQMDKHQAESWGLHKLDILSQRGIGHIKEAVDLVRNNQGIQIDIHDMEKVKNNTRGLDLLRKPGGCIGCFYIESPAMRGLLTQLNCSSYRDLITASSIIRPGVAKSGMMQAFIKCRRGKPLPDLHPMMKELLKETYGIMVFQEDVMKVVHHLAGFDLSECDLLRRLMTGRKKNVNDLKLLQKKFYEKCMRRGLSRAIIIEIWRQISSFSGYAFCKAHSASYAAESMQSLFLKAHFPIEFMVAVINNDGGFYKREVYVWELQKAGATIELPCINNSSWLARVNGTTVWLGLKTIKGLTTKTGKKLLSMRRCTQTIDELTTLTAVIPPGQVDLLIEAGACRSISKNKESLFCQRILHYRGPSNSQLSLFPPRAYLHQCDPPISPVKRRILTQFHLLGITLSSPFDLIDHIPGGLILQSQMHKYEGKRIRMMGYYVIEKPVTTESGKHMAFFTWVDQLGDYFDTVHFPSAIMKFGTLKKGFYIFCGLVHVEWGYPSLVVDDLQCLTPSGMDDKIFVEQLTPGRS